MQKRLYDRRDRLRKRHDREPGEQKHADQSTVLKYLDKYEQQLVGHVIELKRFRIDANWTGEFNHLFAPMTRALPVERLAERTGLPMTLYTQLNGTSRRHCEDRIAEAGLADDLQKPNRRWVFFESGTLEENLYSADPSSLTVVGGAGESLMRQLVFGIKLEIIQKTLPNPLVVVGPECRTIL